MTKIKTRLKTPLEVVRDDLANYNAVNSCETIQALQEAIIACADSDGIIRGRTHEFNAEKMALGALNYYQDPSGAVSPNILTRMWGIRQQAMYLKHYK